MLEPTNPPSQTPDEETLRPHTYDGIQEYDKRLPRWWLLTLYGAMVFAAIYWGYYHTYGVGDSPTVALQTQMEENAARAARNSGVLTDDLVWTLSVDPKVI